MGGGGGCGDEEAGGGQVESHFDGAEDAAGWGEEWEEWGEGGGGAANGLDDWVKRHENGACSLFCMEIGQHFVLDFLCIHGWKLDLMLLRALAALRWMVFLNCL